MMFLTFSADPNLLNRLHVEYGKRKLGGYFFVGVSINYFLRDAEVGADVYKINSLKISSGQLFHFNTDFWPGYTFGFQI
jgi:hypothetical protein